MGHELPGGVHVFFDGNDTRSCGCHELDHVAGLCAMRKILGSLAQIAPFKAVRKCAVGRCGFLLAAEGGRGVSRMAERECGGAAGREEGVRPCGTSSSFQGHETTKPDPVLDRFDSSNQEWTRHESALGHGTVEHSTDESWTAPRRTEVSCHTHCDHGAGSERLDQELERSKSSMEFGRLCAGCNLLRRRCGFGSSVCCCCGGEGGRSNLKIEGSGSDKWCRENTVDEPPKASIVVDGLAVLWEEVSEFVGSTLCFGWKRETCDCTQISSSKQMLGEIILAPEEVALEQCEIDNVAAFSVELERAAKSLAGSEKKRRSLVLHELGCATAVQRLHGAFGI